MMMRMRFDVLVSRSQSDAQEAAFCSLVDVVGVGVGGCM
jgi:hypothetical protein